jgi:hypothetical protein
MDLAHLKLGDQVTTGLSLNRSSIAASVTSKMPSPRIAWAHSAMSRGVSGTSKPTRLLNHCRFLSTSDMSAIGVPQMKEASKVISSNSCSAAVSSNCRSSSARCRAASVEQKTKNPRTVSSPQFVPAKEESAKFCYRLKRW